MRASLHRLAFSLSSAQALSTLPDSAYLRRLCAFALQPLPKHAFQQPQILLFVKPTACPSVSCRLHPFWRDERGFPRPFSVGLALAAQDAPFLSFSVPSADVRSLVELAPREPLVMPSTNSIARFGGQPMACLDWPFTQSNRVLFSSYLPHSEDASLGLLAGGNDSSEACLQRLVSPQNSVLMALVDLRESTQGCE